MINHLLNLRKDLKKVSDKKRAKFVAGYFKTGKGQYGEGDIFIGVTVPDCRVISRKYKGLSLSEVKALLKSKIHEERLIALQILVLKFQKANEDLRKKIFDFYLSHTKYINNWDLVDLSARDIVGAYLYSQCHSGKRVERAHPESLRDSGVGRLGDLPRMTVLNKLAVSKNIWERRIAVLACFMFIKNDQFDHALRISEVLLSDRHDLIHKAVGWMLREVGKRDQGVLEEFLKTHLTKIPRTTLRYAIERFPEQVRKSYLLARNS